MALDWCTDNCFFRTCTIAIYNVSEKCSVNVSKTKRAKRRQFSHCDLVHLPKPFHWILGEISFSCTLFTFRTFRACQKVHSWAVFEYHCLMSTAEMTFSFMCDIVFNLQKVYALRNSARQCTSCYREIMPQSNLALFPFLSEKRIVQIRCQFSL